MSHVPTHEEILAAAEQIRSVFPARDRDPHIPFDGTFWTTGLWNEWRPLVPDRDAVRAGDAQAIEHAVVFLEADPWCFRSGYEKEWIWRALAHVALTPSQLARVEAVLLHVLRHDRRELPAALGFIRRRRSPAMKPALRALLMDDDDEVAAKALRALLAARRPRLSGAEQDRVKDVLRSGVYAVMRMSRDQRRRAVEASYGAAPSWRGSEDR